MSIEVNGVTLPDIPSDVLEQYPYAVITHQIYPTANLEAYMLAVFAEAVHFFSEGSTLNPLDGACNGASFGLGEDGTGTEWTLDNTVENEAVNMPIMSEDYMTIEVVAANYDILTVDADGNATDTVYFAANISTSHPSEYSIPHDDVVFLADQTRRLTGGTGKLGFAEIKSGLESVEVGSGLEFDSSASGYIPDIPEGEALSVLIADEFAETTATGNLTDSE